MMLFFFSFSGGRIKWCYGLYILLFGNYVDDPRRHKALAIVLLSLQCKVSACGL